MRILTDMWIIIPILILLGGCAELRDELPAPTSGGVSVHADGWINPSSAGFHGKAIRTAGWDMRPCGTCHGSDYRGGVAEVSCRTCHAGTGGPEDCSTCHGSASSPAPPEDIAGNTASAAPGVGAHAAHVNGGDLSINVRCYDCHNVPPTVYTAGHVDSELPAEVPMNGALARTQSPGVAPFPAFDYQALTCANAYCHGNWKLDRVTSGYSFIYTADSMSGANFTPVWTGGSSEAACGTCHGLPPTGHATQSTTGPDPQFELTQCFNCHLDVVDNAGRIADKTLHINGKINAFGNEYDF